MIKIIKLHNNTEIIGNVVNDEGNNVTMEDPFTINYMFSPKSDRPIIGLLRYLPFADERIINFSKKNMLNFVTARPSMSRYYSVTLSNHLTDIDDSIDRELDYVCEIENPSKPDQDPAEILTAIFQKFQSNDNLH